MRLFFSTILVFSAFFLNAQGVYSLTTKSKERVWSISTSDQLGTWIELRPLKLVGVKTNTRLIRLKPDLSGIAWEKEVELGNESQYLLLDRQGGSAYFSDIRSGMSGFGNSKLSAIIQIAPDGRVTRKEPDTKGLNNLLMEYVDNEHYNQIWSKDGSDDLALVRYKHKGLAQSQVDFALSRIARKEGYDDWKFGGISNNQEITFVRYGETKSAAAGTSGLLKKFPAEGMIQAASFDMKSGKLLRTIDYKYQDTNPVIAPAKNIRRPSVSDSKLTPLQISGGFNRDTRTETKGNFTVYYYKDSAFGSLLPALDGSGYYFVATLNYKGKKTSYTYLPNPEGFYVEKIDLSGKRVWLKTEKLAATELANTSNVPESNTIEVFQDSTNGNLVIEFTMAMNRIAGWNKNQILKTLDGKTGNVLHSRKVSHKISDELIEGKVSLNEKNIEHLNYYPYNQSYQKALNSYLLKNGCKDFDSTDAHGKSVIYCSGNEKTDNYKITKIMVE